ncbi:diacylglycerol kinase family protein [soil metagenome]
MSRLLKSFTFALKGIKIYLQSGGNVFIHLVAGGIVILLGYIFKISSAEWIVLILCIGMVLGAEALNTAIEELTNLVSPEYHEQAGKVKDLAAGAVLIISLMAAIIGFIIFVPKILALL